MAPLRGGVAVFGRDEHSVSHACGWVSTTGGVGVEAGPGRTRARRRVPDVSALHGRLQRLDRHVAEPGG